MVVHYDGSVLAESASFACGPSPASIWRKITELAPDGSRRRGQSPLPCFALHLEPYCKIDFYDVDNRIALIVFVEQNAVEMEARPSVSVKICFGSWVNKA